MADELPTLTPCPDIIIATPGRLLDLLQRGALEIHDPATVVVDEFDKTLDLGFADEMRRLMRRIGRPGSLVLTSATPMDHAELPQWAQRPGCQTLDYSAPAEKSGHLDRVEVESPGARLLSVICKRSMKVGRASTSSAARKANAGFHALR